MDMRQSAAGGGDQAVMPPEGTRAWDFVNSNQDEILALLKPTADRTRIMLVVAGALLVGLGLGWTFATSDTVFNVSQSETPPRRLPEIRPSGGKSDGPRRMAAVSVGGAVAKADAAGAPFPNQAYTGSISREPIAAMPETKPTTIAGWKVLEVRGGTVVLEGPEGVRTAARGDVVPGVGRIDSIVRWGNRWIVATSSGLIADQ